MADYEYILEKAKDIWNDKIPDYIKYCGATILAASLASVFSYESARYLTTKSQDANKQIESAEVNQDENKRKSSFFDLFSPTADKFKAQKKPSAPKSSRKQEEHTTAHPILIVLN